MTQVNYPLKRKMPKKIVETKAAKKKTSETKAMQTNRKEKRET
jgi:hypothetical protein